MKTPCFKPILLISLFSAFVFTACQKGDVGNNNSDSTSSKGNNSNNSNNNGSNGNTVVTIPNSATPYTVSTFAGSHQSGTVDGTGIAAGFQSPRALTMDASGNLFVTDPLINEIRKITTPGAVVTTIATSGSLNSVTALLTVDANDNLYISETSPYKVTQGGVITPMNLGFPNAHALVADGSGNIFVATNSAIYKTTAAGGSATLFAGNPNLTPGVVDGTGTAAAFNSINALATDASGNLYATDVKSGTPVIRKITPAGVVTTITLTPVAPIANTANTTYSGPIVGGLAIDGSGNFYATDTGNNRILKVTAAGAVTVIAGTGAAGQINGAGTISTFNLPMGIAVNTAGNIIYVADVEGQVIRKIIPTP